MTDQLVEEVRTVDGVGYEAKLRGTRAERTKKKILIAAEEAFAQKGFYGARIDEIAQNAGVNKRLIYEYFGKKEDLYTRILEDVYKRLNECETDIIQFKNTMHPADAIGALVQRYFMFLSHDLNYVRMVMWENMNQAAYFKAKGLDDIRNPIKYALRGIIKHGQEMQLFRDNLDEKQILMTLFAIPFNYYSNIYTMSAIMRADLFTREERMARAQHITDMLLAYMRK